VARTRDFQAEYRRRIERAADRGLSRSQGRGHARSGEAPLKPGKARADPKAEAALGVLRKTGSLTRAAKDAGISAERFRRLLREHGLAERRGRTWTITDERVREIRIYSRKRYKLIRVQGFERASEIGRYLEAVKHLLDTNDASRLKPFEGRSVEDARGRVHPYEVNPNILYELANAGSGTFENVYRLVSPF